MLNLKKKLINEKHILLTNDDVLDIGRHFSNSLGVMQCLALDKQVACSIEMRSDTYKSEQ